MENKICHSMNDDFSDNYDSSVYSSEDESYYEEYDENEDEENYRNMEENNEMVDEYGEYYSSNTPQRHDPVKPSPMISKVDCTIPEINPWTKQKNTPSIPSSTTSTTNVKSLKDIMKEQVVEEEILKKKKKKTTKKKDCKNKKASLCF